MQALTAFSSGMLAGFGVALPLGPIGVLLIQEGVARGLRRGAPGAAAVAVVDTAYCLGAVALGAVATPAIVALGDWPKLVGGTALLTVAALGIRRAFRAPVAGGRPDGSSLGSGWRRFALFLGLTAISPATLIYFAAIALGLTGLVGSPGPATLFVAGTGVASAAWQLALVAAGGLFRRRTTPRTRRITALIGNAMVATLGAVMLIDVATGWEAWASPALLHSTPLSSSLLSGPIEVVATPAKCRMSSIEASLRRFGPVWIMRRGAYEGTAPTGRSAAPGPLR